MSAYLAWAAQATATRIVLWEQQAGETLRNWTATGSGSYYTAY